MTDFETTVAMIGPMTAAEFLDRLQAISNRFIAAALLCQATLDADLKALDADPAFKELEAKQRHLCRAIIDSEMQRMAEALPK